ncbi:MAG: cytochrome ubiquinol oxidase subunit I [Proteobacteria bacterium]|nr:MAG: cytochrome ubiquinol oxidase subunit I [Pseudomonadota bacterium]
MDTSALMLARIQFAANITFHILFPAITIALAWVLLYFKVRHGRAVKNVTTADAERSPWMDAYRFWVKIFALSFALGIVSGVTMSFQFGTNWPGFMNTVGNIAGPLLAYEVLTAFFLEATFLAIMLFGMNRVSNRTHTLATFLVAFGTTLSAFWILALNSWMQTPVGYEMREGIAHATDWMAILFNPSLPYRLTHMLIASGLTVAFLIAGVSSYRWLRGDRGDDVRVALRTAVITAAVLTPLQIVVGDLHGLNTLEHQPAKLAAMEGFWETQSRQPAVLFAWPDEARRENRFEVAIPGLASYYLVHDFEGEVRGLNDFRGEHPPVAPVFFAFRIMVGIGVLMLVFSWIGAYKLRRRAGMQGELPPWLARTFVAMTFSGWVAVVAGWYVTEIGRQPYLVQGVLPTADAASDVPSGAIGLTLTMYLALYVFLILAYVSVLFFIARKARVPDQPPAITPTMDVNQVRS